MTYDWKASLGEVSDAQLRAALEQAHIPALLASIIHLTGKADHFQQVQPRFELFAENDDGLTEEERSGARKLAFDALKDYRAHGELIEPSAAVIVDTMQRITGEQFPEHLLPMLREELNLFAEDTRRVDIDTQSMTSDFQVLIIGSGMSGIAAAFRLKQQGIPFLVLEKNPEVGGTWYENTYPGCQVDSANHLYNYIFDHNTQWPNHFSGQAELYQYFSDVVDKHDLRQHIRVNSTVSRARYDETTGLWTVTIEQNGLQQELLANAVISAVGQLNIPKYPEFKGFEDFSGTSFHSARWDHQYDLSDKRVAVIGTGCSAVQFVPEIAPSCRKLTIFQRSPPWLLPVDEYHTPMTEEELWLFRELPFYGRWYRFFLFRTRAVDGELPLLYSDPDWSGPPNTVSEGNQLLRDALIDSVTEQCAGDTELLEKLIPSYPPGGKRPVVDDGSWIRTLKRDNVNLETDSIKQVVTSGIVTEGGELHECDVIIFGTGFTADEFLANMQIYGREGKRLATVWGGNARAYKGAMVPGFPNFYTLYGPNTNIVVGSSIIFYVECQLRYVLGCLKLQLEQGHRALECREEVMEAYNQQIDALNRQRAWGASQVSSWYKNRQGRVTQNWPGTHWEFWKQTRSPEPDELVFDKH
ncbi:NAD(P)/FAD-dependent oxidoreductase [Seongchinamella unica]|uniref:NAD(P)/FAD-dependent oxidoreductase n=1 Tax=Seongchinamella unica TaxID=2547392 RepID=A0A4R5LMU6_9GAMM|nr:NAD(P)/FAD-dependent oxidoreductase [Seongchinamella unica]TDG11368.1 NAD(P)/FAD-dependent oxidoreductase [Seongchinamella unica]